MHQMNEDDDTVPDDVLRQKYWRCLFCSNKKNSMDVKLCKICKNHKQPNRIGIQYKDSLYLCRTHTIYKIPTVTIFRVYPQPEIQFKAIIPAIGVNLYDCILEVLEAATNDNLDLAKDSKILLNEHDVMPLSKSSTFNDTDRRLSLFDSVIENAHSLAYDGYVGRYVDLKSVAQKLTSEETSMNYKIDFQYPKSMLTSQKELDWAVEEAIKQSKQETSKDEDITTQHKMKGQCYLCDYSYPKNSLAGIISLKTVLKWKKDHDVFVNLRDKRYVKYSNHDGVAICVFCMQFFDENYSTVLEYAAQQRKIDDIASRGQSPERTIEKQCNSANERPLSRLIQRISVAQLKIRAEISKSRFQVQKLNHRSRIVDITRVGTLLRDKYKDDGEIMKQRRKAELNEIIVRKRNIKYDTSIRRVKTANPQNVSKGKLNVNSSTFLTESEVVEGSKLDASLSTTDRILSSSSRRVKSASSYQRYMKSTSSSRVSTNRSNQHRSLSDIPSRAQSTDAVTRKKKFLSSDRIGKPRSQSAAPSRTGSWRAPSINSIFRQRGTPAVKKKQFMKDESIQRVKEKRFIKAINHNRKPLMLAVPDIVADDGFRIIEFQSHKDSMSPSSRDTFTPFLNEILNHEKSNYKEESLELNANGNISSDIIAPKPESDKSSIRMNEAKVMISKSNQKMSPMKNVEKKALGRKLMTGQTNSNLKPSDQLSNSIDLSNNIESFKANGEAFLTQSIVRNIGTSDSDILFAREVGNYVINRDNQLAEEHLVVTENGLITASLDHLIIDDSNTYGVTQNISRRPTSPSQNMKYVTPEEIIADSKVDDDRNERTEKTTMSESSIDIRSDSGAHHDGNASEDMDALIIGKKTFWMKKDESIDFNGTLEDFIRKHDIDDSRKSRKMSQTETLFTMITEPIEILSRGKSRGSSRSAKKRHLVGETKEIAYIKVLDPPYSAKKGNVNIVESDDRSIADEGIPTVKDL